jgi:RNA polymerase sigma-70 factor, ECF subfamily
MAQIGWYPFEMCVLPLFWPITWNNILHISDHLRYLPRTPVRFTDMTQLSNPFGVQRSVRGPWRRYVDQFAEHRPALHAYCRRLTGNVWDGEDLVQDTLVRVFSLLGKTDAQLENPKSYLIRTAANLWIDRVRRSVREQAAMVLEQAEPTSVPPHEASDVRWAAQQLFQILHPQERAAILMKDVFELSLEEIAAMLHTTVGAVKSALGRGRGRLDGRKPPAGFDAPPKEIVEQFMRALRDKDMKAMKALCSETLCCELVGGIETDSFDKARTIFEHAHMVMPKMGFGDHPSWKVAEYESEPVVLGFRTLDGVEGLNEIHRLEVSDGRIMRVRTYCFCPETLTVVAEALGCPALRRPYRSPSIGDFIIAMLGLRRFRMPRLDTHDKRTN